MRVPTQLTLVAMLFLGALLTPTAPSHAFLIKRKPVLLDPHSFKAGMELMSRRGKLHIGGHPTIDSYLKATGDDFRNLVIQLLHSAPDVASWVKVATIPIVGGMPRPIAAVESDLDLVPRAEAEPTDRDSVELRAGLIKYRELLVSEHLGSLFELRPDFSEISGFLITYAEGAGAHLPAELVALSLTQSRGPEEWRARISELLERDSFVEELAAHGFPKNSLEVKRVRLQLQQPLKSLS